MILARGRKMEKLLAETSRGADVPQGAAPLPEPRARRNPLAKRLNPPAGLFSCLRGKQEASETPRLSPASLHPHFAAGAAGAAAPPRRQLSPPIAAPCLPDHRGPVALSGPASPPRRAGISPSNRWRHKDTHREQPAPGCCSEMSKTCRQNQRWSRSGIPVETQPQLPETPGTQPGSAWAEPQLRACRARSRGG